MHGHNQRRSLFACGRSPFACGRSLFDCARSASDLRGGRDIAALVLLVLTLAGCSTVLPASAPVEAGVYAFTGVNVVPMTPGSGVLPDHTVIVRAGRIAQLGPAASTAIPPGARRIDGAGRYLMPGLGDMHVHLEYSRDPAMLALFVVNGVTTVRSMDGRPYIAQWRDAVARGELTGPTIHTAGPILDGDPPLLDDNLRIATPAAARAEVMRQAQAGYDFVKVYVNLDSAVYRAVLDAAADAGLRVAGHAPRAVGLAGVLRAPLWSLEHLSDFATAIEASDSPFRGRFHWAKLFLGMPADPERLADVAQRVAAAGMWVVPTLVERDRALAPADTVARWLRDPVMAHVSRLDPAALHLWRDQLLRSTARMDEADWPLIAQGRVNRLQLVRALHRAGVPLALGTDTPNPFVVPGFAVHEELAALVEAGLTPAAALAAATRDAARLLDQLDEWGTIEPGRRADLLLLDANPLADVAAVRNPAGVMLRGRWLPGDSLRALLPPLP